MRDLRGEIQEQLLLLGDDYPEVRKELWNLFKLLKKPERDEAREKALEQEIENLKKQIEILQQAVPKEEEDGYKVDIKVDIITILVVCCLAYAIISYCWSSFYAN